MASELIWDAVSATCHFWEPPSFECQHCKGEVSMVSFIDADKVRRKRDYGRCYIRAGWKRCSARTKGGLVVVHIGKSDMPRASEPLGYAGQLTLQEQIV